MRHAKKNNKAKYIVIIGAIVVLLAVGTAVAFKTGLFTRGAAPEYSDDGEKNEEITKEKFNIDTVRSSVDFDGDGVDDYTDILLGARIDAQNHPRYDGTYQAGGYPPDDVGVCADVIWRAFKNAGYCLRDMIDNDIIARREAYPNITTRDNQIDFRRVVNLRVYFDTYAQILTTDINKIEEWQPGDIVIFGANKHIGVVSDKRNINGQPLIIHNGGQANREEDYLPYTSYTIAAHYRFDASQIDPDLLVAWHE